MNKPILECRDLHKSFNEGGLSVNVLRGVNLSINSGERVAIVGSSGSGKSTLLHLLGGLDEPNRGEVQVAGKNIHRLNPAARGHWRNRTLGFVYQFHHLLPEFSALENVCMPLLIRGEKPAIAKQKALSVLEKVGLEHRIHHKPGEMSGGERQRAAVARAVVNRPQCVLADEPTGNLDRQTAEKVYQMLLELNTEIQTALVMVTHDPNLAERMDRTLYLHDGELTAS